MIRWKYTNRDELYHHGRKGMKWGQHIFAKKYKNSDGSLNPRGTIEKARVSYRHGELIGGRANKKFYNKDGSLNEKGAIQKAKLEDRYTKLTGKKIAHPPVKEGSAAKVQKTIAQMTNKEIQAKINRIQLEKQLKNLQPEEKTLGQKMIDKYGDKIANRVIDYAADTGKRILENKLKDALGVGDDEMTTLKKEVDLLDLKVRKKNAEDKLKGVKDNEGDESERLRKEATDYKNKLAIHNAKKLMGEDNHSESASKPDSKPETPKKENPKVETPSSNTNKLASESKIENKSAKETKQLKDAIKKIKIESPSRAVKNEYAKRLLEEAKASVEREKKVRKAMADAEAENAKRIASDPNKSQIEKDNARRQADLQRKYYENTVKDVTRMYENAANNASLKSAIKGISASNKAKRKQKNSSRYKFDLTK